MLFFIKSNSLTGMDLYNRLHNEIKSEFKTVSQFLVDDNQFVISIDVSPTVRNMQVFVNVLSVRLQELISSSQNMIDCKVSTSVNARTGVVFNRAYNHKHRVFIDAAYFGVNKNSVLSQLTLLNDFKEKYTVDVLRRHGMREKMIKINYLDSLMQDLDNLAFRKPHARSLIFELYSKSLIQKYYLLGHNLYTKEVRYTITSDLIDFSLRHAMLEKIDFDYMIVKNLTSLNDEVPSADFLTRILDIELKQQLRFNVLMSRSVKNRLYYYHIYYVEQRYEQKSSSFYLHRRKQQLQRKLKTAENNNQRLIESHRLFEEGFSLTAIARKIKARLSTVKSYLDLGIDHDFTKNIIDELRKVNRRLKNPKKYRKLTSKVRFLIQDIDRWILNSRSLESIYIISDKRANGQVFKRSKLRFYIQKRYREIRAM